MSRKQKSTVLPGRPFVPFLAWFLGFVPICPSLLTHRWPKISSYFIRIYEKIAGGRGSAPDPAGGAHDAPPDP